MFHFLRFVLFVPPMDQWSWLCRTKAEHDEAAIIQRNVSRRPPMACQHPDEKHQMRFWISWMLPTSSIHDIRDILMNFDKIWREITDINLFGFRDLCRCQRSSMDLQDIHCQGRKAPARGKPRLHRPLATETCLELSGETRFQPALSTWICLGNYD